MTRAAGRWNPKSKKISGWQQGFFFFLVLKLEGKSNKPSIILSLLFSLMSDCQLMNHSINEVKGSNF